MSFITKDSGICLSPYWECPEIGATDCDPNPYIKSGQRITIVNACNMSLNITGFVNPNSGRFTIIDFPHFSGTGVYDQTDPLTELPKILEPYEEWEINTWWHPTAADLSGARAGTPSYPTGDAWNAKIRVLPGDLGFVDCENYFAISGELLCDIPEFDGFTRGTYFPTAATNFPPVPDPCYDSSSTVYSASKIYPSTGELYSDQPSGIYSLIKYMADSLSGTAVIRDYQQRSLMAAVSTNIAEIQNLGQDGDLNNLYTSSKSLANPWIFGGNLGSAVIEAGGNPSAYWKIANETTGCPLGPASIGNPSHNMSMNYFINNDMQSDPSKEGFAGVSYRGAEYFGASFGWNYNDNCWQVYFASGFTDAGSPNAALGLQMFLARSGESFLPGGNPPRKFSLEALCNTPRDDSTSPVREMGDSPGSNGFDSLNFSVGWKGAVDGYFNKGAKARFVILSDGGGVHGPDLSYISYVCGAGGDENVTQNTFFEVSIDRVTSIGGVHVPLDRRASIANPPSSKGRPMGSVTTPDFPNSLYWIVNDGSAPTCADSSPGGGLFSLNNNGDDQLGTLTTPFYNDLWIPNGPIEVADRDGNVIVDKNNTLVGNLASLQLADVQITQNDLGTPYGGTGPGGSFRMTITAMENPNVFNIGWRLQPA